LGAVTNINTSATSFSLPYTATTGSPNQYSIATVTPTAMASFSVVTNAALGSSPISIPAPASSVSTYNFTITAKNTTTGCVSSGTPFTVQVVKDNSTIVVTGSTSFNYNASAQGPSANTKTGSTGAVTYSYSGVSPTVYSASATAPTAVGTYQVVATLASDANYNGISSVAFAFEIVKDNSTIVVTGLTSFNYNGSAQGPSTNTKTGSTGAVTYSYSAVSPTVYSASATAPAAVGTYQVVATLASDANYNGASSVAYAFNIINNISTITVTGLTSFTYNGSAQGPTTNTKTGSTGAVTYSYSGVSPTVYATTSTAPTAVGTYQVIAGLASDANYPATTSVAYAFTIIAAPSTIVVTGATSFSYNGNSQGPSTNTKTGSTGVVTYSYQGTGNTSYGPSTVAPTNAGAYEVVANLATDANFNAASSAAYAFTIQKINPTLVLANIIKIMGDPSFTITATSNSNGAIVYSMGTAAVATITGNTVSLVGLGISTITVTQAESINYNAGSTTATLTVTPSAPVTSNGTYVLGFSGNPSNTNLLITPIAGATINFYPAATGGSPTNTQTLPSTVGVYTFYVSQTINGIEGPRVAYVVTILPEIKTRNATYIIGGSNNPATISSLVSFITSGSKPQWCDVAGNNCSNIAPALPTTAGVTIWCVKAIDTISGLASAPCIYDTVKMLTTASVMAITKLASKPLLNPDGTFTLQYKFTVSNPTSEVLDSVQITDDLRSVFVSPVTYEIISLTTGSKLTANSSYNGSSQINLLGYPSKLLGLQSDTVLLVVKISPKGYSGSINNTALISGVSPLSGRVGPVLSNDPTNYNNSGSSKPTLTILPLLNIIIPSGFSPNNDGINDNFAIIHPYNSSVSLEVFNRWGNIVYKNGNYNNEWYGKGVGNFLGQDLPAGTYYYVVNATDKSNNQVSNFVGYLTLKR
jgi:gliding motility-associated-like protein